VSTDGGATWHPAVGRASWSYTWTPNAAGSAVIKCRAVDDSGNLQTPGAGVTVTVSTSNTLAAAYSFDEGTGSTVADATGKGNGGTISGATWVTTGKYGKALSFNGTNSWVTVADSATLDLANAMTLEAWVNPTTINGWECVLMKEAGTDLAYALYGDDNGEDAGQPRRPIVSVRQGNNTYWTPGTAQLALNTWTHLAATYDGTNLKMYVNGSLASSQSRTGPINVSSGALRIGGDSIWGEYFNGLIDEVRIYSRALGQAEIQTDMNTQVNSDTQAPTVPGNVSATGGVGSVSLSWSASSDNVGVANYNVYRSTTSGFTPSAANRIAQPAGTSYTDSGLAAGTYYYKVTAQDAAGNLSASSAEASGTATADTTAPSVSVTAPTNGATVSGTVTVTASASDNVGVAGVQFLLDGVNLGAEDTASPYSVSWDTAAASNGTHTLTARARDAAGNATTSAAVTVTVNNTAATGLVAAYAFNEGTGTSTADSSGNGLTGTAANTSWSASGKFGKALSFNGVNSWVTVNDAAALDLTGGLTLEAWVNPIALVSGRTVLLKEAGTEEVYSLYASENMPRPLGAVRIGGAYSTATGTGPLPVNTWSHLASTYDGTTLRLYVNGSLVGSVAASGNIEVSGGVLRIGGNAIWGEYFSGLIDEVRVYNRALTAAQIQTDMTTPIGSPEHLLGDAVATNAAPLSQKQVRPLFNEAVRRWSAALGDAAAARRLRAVDVQIMDLPGTALGLAASTVIYLDANGAGHGWFLDPTPRDDSEFAPGLAHSPAAGKVDLLTVLTHEMGHILGLDDDHAADPVTGSVMSDALPLGVRRIHLDGLLPAAPAPVAPVPQRGMASSASRPGTIPAALPAIGPSAPAGPIASRRDDVLEAAPATVRPPVPSAREDRAWQLSALLEPRAWVAEKSGLDLFFADWWRTPDDPFSGNG
jgi:hypothetical protein